MKLIVCFNFLNYIHLYFSRFLGQFLCFAFHLEFLLVIWNILKYLYFDVFALKPDYKLIQYILINLIMTPLSSSRLFVISNLCRDGIYMYLNPQNFSVLIRMKYENLSLFPAMLVQYSVRWYGLIMGWQWVDYVLILKVR